jgi:hypothetical protein
MVPATGTLYAGFDSAANGFREWVVELNADQARDDENGFAGLRSEDSEEAGFARVADRSGILADTDEDWLVALDSERMERED